MIVTLHQPNYLPWLGFFSKVQHSDCYVVMDCVQLPNRPMTNRNKIRQKIGWCYLTIPIASKYKDARIIDVKLPTDNRWQKLHWVMIHSNYARADFFRDYKDILEELYLKDFKYLWQMNEEIISFLFKCLDINVKVYKQSELNIDPDLHGTDAMIATLKSVGANTYLSGPSGKKYLDFKKFPQNNIDLQFFNFQHPVYKQRFPGFEPNMAAIDLLFNAGAEAGNIIYASGHVEDPE